MPLVLLLLSLLSAVPQRPTDVVQWTPSMTSSWVTAGGTLELVVNARVQDGWKLYALDQPANGPRPLSFAVAKPFAVVTKKIGAPPAKVLKDPLFDANTRYYEKAVAIRIPISIPADLAGMHEVPLEVTFQACGADICLRPFTQKLPVHVEVRR